MPDEQIQQVYDELNRRGIFKGNEQAAAIGHELRRRGVVSDPTQGGIESSPAAQVSGQMKGMDPDFSSRLNQMIQASGGRLSITDGFRTSAQQADAYRRKPNLAAPPGHSLHEKGLAADLAGDLDWAHANGERFGLVFPMLDKNGKKFEPWHVQPANYANKQPAKAAKPGLQPPPQYDAVNQAVQSRPTQLPDPGTPTDDQLNQYRMDFFNTNNMRTDAGKANIPMALAVSLAKNPKDPVAQELYRRQSPVGQVAIAQKAKELTAEFSQELAPSGGEGATVMLRDKGTGKTSIVPPSHQIAAAVRGPEGAQQLQQAKGFGPSAERFAYSLSDPENIAIAGLAGAGGILAPAVAPLISGGFAGMAGKQAIDKYQAGDPGGAAFDALLGVAAGAHAVKGAGEAIGAVRNAGDISTPNLSEGLYSPRPRQAERTIPGASTAVPDQPTPTVQPTPPLDATRRRVNLSPISATPADDIRALVESVANRTAKPADIVVHTAVTPETARRIAEATGIDVNGYAHVVDASAINHILNEHAKETRAGQLPVTPEDIARIPDVVSSPDLVEAAGQTRRGLDAIRYQKRINGHLLYVEEVRSGKGRLAAQTLYKYPAGGDAVAEVRGAGGPKPSPHTPETLPDTPPASIVGEKGISVNSEAPPVRRQPKTTGPANVITEAERTARGLEPVTKQEYTLVNQAYEIGRKAVDEGRIEPRSLAEDVAAKPRPLNAEEVGALAYDRSQLINSHNAAMKAAGAAVEAGDMRTAQTERARINSIESLLDLNDQALAKGGREQSAAFAARKMLVAEDYSYAGMLQRAKTAKGEKLTETQRGQVQVLQHTINGLTEAVAKHQQRIAELESQRSIRKAAREDAFAVRTTGRKMTRQSLDNEYAQLKDAFVKGGSKLSAGLDPETAAIVGKMAVNRLKATGVKISDVVDHIYTDLKAHIPDLRRDDIRDAFNQAQSEPLEAQKQRTTESAAEYRRRLDTGEVVPPQRRNTLPYDRELEQLKMDQERAKRAYQQMVQNIGRTPGQRLARGTGEVFDAGRSVITSVDLSAPGRQGFFLAAARPITAAKSVVPMLKAAVSEHGARQVDIEIHSRPNAPHYADSGLYISPVEHTGKLSALEEAYRSNLAERIPGIGPLVRGSERAYVTFLNKLRADNFDLLHQQVERMGEKDMAEADRAIANFINKATGRGSLGETGDRAATLLNRIFFSPRFVASRFQLLAGSPLYGGTAASRAVIAQTYLQYAGAVSGVIYLSYLAGAKVETNYHSPDFLKIRFGNQAVVDVHAGLQQTARFLANMYSGDQNRGELIARFARGKTSPFAGTAIDIASGKDFIGQKVNTPKEVVQNLRRGRVKPKDYFESEPARNLVPMSIKDIREAAMKENVPTATALAMLAILGVGVAEYPKKNVSTHSRSAYAR